MTTNVQREMTRKLLERMQSGDLPWRKQWEHTGVATMPFNWPSKIDYTGITLSFYGWQWMTSGTSTTLG